MNSFRFFVILFILSLSSIVQSKIQDEYIIEVIVFEQLEIIGNETLQPKNLNLEEINTITLLDKPEIVLNKKTILQSFDYEDTELLIDQLIIEKNKNEQNQAHDT